MKKPKIDKTKIVKGQIKYVIKLMEIANKVGYERGYEDGKQQSLKHNILLMKSQIKASKEINGKNKKT